MDVTHQAGIALPAHENCATLIAARRIDSRAFIELSIGFVLVILTLWSYGAAQWALGLGALCWMIFATFRARPTAAQLGLRVASTRRALWIVAVALIAGAVGVWLSVRLHTFHAVFQNFAVEWGFLAYIVWALVQQFLLQDFFLARLLRIAPTRTLAVVSAGLLFGMAHVPNPLLVVATVVWGTIACALFLRYRNLYVLAVAHAIFGMCLAVTVPNAVHHHMRVGLGYLRWHGRAAPAQHQTPQLGLYQGTTSSRAASPSSPSRASAPAGAPLIRDFRMSGRSTGKMDVSTESHSSENNG